MKNKIEMKREINENNWPGKEVKPGILFEKCGYKYVTTYSIRTGQSGICDGIKKTLISDYYYYGCLEA